MDNAAACLKAKPQPSQHLLAQQSQQWKHLKKVWNLFKVNNKHTRTTSQWHRSVVFIVNFKQISQLFWWFYCWLGTSKCRLLSLQKQRPGSILKNSCSEKFRRVFFKNFELFMQFWTTQGTPIHQFRIQFQF